MGDLALNLRGCADALEIYMRSEKWEFVKEQLLRANDLKLQLKAYNEDKSLLKDNLIAWDWLKIANAEIENLDLWIWRANSKYILHIV